MTTPIPAVESAAPAARTIGELRAAGWVSVPVRVELRRNVAARLQAGEPLVPGVLGFDDSVVPELEHALLAGHDVILLGERGQAKSRILRSLVSLLDEWIPVVAGSEINDDPDHPISRHARALVAEHGDATPITWRHRSDRYAEKLATPDTSIADLIGEVDPIKVAEGRYLSDEMTLHYGLVPQTNRGIFAINELPDLAERIQVGLLNVLEERDVQIRGHRIRLPLDVLLVATANPDDYTSRGRIITPLKDRFGAQVRTHYPRDVATEVAIVAGEAVVPSDVPVPVTVPPFMAEVVVRLSQEARESPRVNQRSGVSVRLSVANQETLQAAALRRALRLGEKDAVPRVSDLVALASSTLGKIEVESLEEGEDRDLLAELVDRAVRDTFRSTVDPKRLSDVVGAFAGGLSVETGSQVPAAHYAHVAAEVPALGVLAAGLVGAEAPAPLVASAVELVLEGLHLSRRLNKDPAGDDGATYRGR